MISSPYLCICVFCMIQLALLIAMENRRRNAHISHERFFLVMLVIVECSFTADIISNLKASAPWMYPFIQAGVYMEMILNTLLLPIYFWYVCEQVTCLNNRLKKRMNMILWGLMLLCSLFVLSTVFTGCIFYFDADHVYHRGVWFMLPMSIMLLMMFIVEGFLILQRNRIEARYYSALMFFLIAPLIGWLLQSVFFGLPYALLGITIAAQIVYNSIQNQNIDKDYLTGAFNRWSMDRYILHKMNNVSKQRWFAVILLDIDDFKHINDQFGHMEGDAALINAVHILREAVRHSDFIARYGGDEFCVVLDCDNIHTVGEVIRRIDARLQDFNKAQCKQYQLSFSMGCAEYDPQFEHDVQRFLKRVDDLMYSTKKEKKALQNPADESRTVCMPQ